MNIYLERLTVEDIHQVNIIQKLAFQDSFEKYKFCPAFQCTDDQMLAFSHKSDAYKIILDGVIIGSIFLYKISDNHYELDTISIDPSYQNIGVGCETIKLIEKLYSNVTIWTLSTPHTDYRNRHFYEKHGYIQIGVEPVTEYLELIKYKKDLISMSYV